MGIFSVASYIGVIQLVSGFVSEGVDPCVAGCIFRASVGGGTVSQEPPMLTF